jgi:hypothetical protein
LLALLLLAGLALPVLAAPQDAKQDMQNTGQDTNNAAKKTVDANKKTANKTGHAVKKGY